MVDRPPLHKQGYTRGGVAVLPLPVPGVARYDRPGPAGLPPSPRVDPACQLVNMLCPLPQLACVDPACQLVNMLCQRRGLDGRFLSVGLMGSYELGCWACGPRWARKRSIRGADTPCQLVNLA